MSEEAFDDVAFWLLVDSVENQPQLIPALKVDGIEKFDNNDVGKEEVKLDVDEDVGTSPSYMTVNSQLFDVLDAVSICKHAYAVRALVTLPSKATDAIALLTVEYGVDELASVGCEELMFEALLQFEFNAMSILISSLTRITSVDNEREVSVDPKIPSMARTVSSAA